jgi:hypothetical protein
MSVECTINNSHINEHKQRHLMKLLVIGDKGSMLESTFLQVANNI